MTSETYTTHTRSTAQEPDLPAVPQAATTITNPAAIAEEDDFGLPAVPQRS